MLVARRAARAGARRARPPRRGLRGAGTCAPLDADGRAHAAAAGGPDDVRVEGGGLARRDASRRAGGSADVSDERLAAQLGGAAGTLAALGDGGARGRRALRPGARARGAFPPVAHGPPAHRRARSRTGGVGGSSGEGRPRHRAARADRGRRGGRGGGRGLLDDAAEAQPGALVASRSPARGSPTHMRESCSASSHTSTNVRSAAGTPNGRRSRARSRSQAAPLLRPRTPWRASRSTPRECARTSTRARASSSPSASRTRSRPAWAAPARTSSSPKPRGRRRFAKRSSPTSARVSSADELDLLLDPTTYLGAAEELVDRALAEYEEARG